MAMKFGISTFINDNGIDTLSLARGGVAAVACSWA
jgi:hypothetical protein